MFTFDYSSIVTPINSTNYWSDAPKRMLIENDLSLIICVARCMTPLSSLMSWNV